MTDPTNRREFVKLASAAFTFSHLTNAEQLGPVSNLTASPILAQPDTARERLNVLYLHSHDTGRYLSPYGYPSPTPNILKLAQHGVLFRNAFSAAPTCSPSRSAFLTGQAPHSCNMAGLVNFGFSMEHYERHMLHIFQDAGYKTVACGIQHIVKDANVLGYDEILHQDGNLETGFAKIVTPQVVDFLNRPQDRPFFLAVGFKETHRPYDTPTIEDDSRYTIPPVPIADTAQTRLDMAGFHASTRILDDAIGRILDALDKNGFAGNTLVIYTTDHGLAMPEMKCSLRDTGVGVALLMRGPREFSGGNVCDALVSHLDVFPTLCEYLGMKAPDWLQGRSLLPLLRGEKTEINEAVHAEVNYHISYEPKRMVRTQRYKYIRHFLDRNHPVIANCDASPSKDFWLSHDWQNQLTDHEELYDVALDPSEGRNLLADAAHHAVLQDMRARLGRWMLATNDPILKGRIPAPQGARIWDPDGAFPGPKFITVP